ncbi:MAG: hypothetical protein ACREIR_06910, partial [Geminicoccaceae bacterium]
SIQAAEYLRPGGMIILDNADWHFETCKKLREHDLLQVDFAGFKPAHDDVQTTSVFCIVHFARSLCMASSPKAAWARASGRRRMTAASRVRARDRGQSRPQPGFRIFERSREARREFRRCAALRPDRLVERRAPGTLPYDQTGWSSAGRGAS